MPGRLERLWGAIDMSDDIKPAEKRRQPLSSDEARAISDSPPLSTPGGLDLPVPGFSTPARGNALPRRLPTQASIDQLQKHFGRQPHEAIAELVWNALDADAGRVSVDLVTKKGGMPFSIDEIIISDNGHGIKLDLDKPEGFRHPFEQYGHSAKDRLKTSPGGRNYHGRAGQGRYKALSLGGEIGWETTFADDSGARYSCAFSLTRNSNDIRLHYLKPAEEHQKLGTKCRISSLIGGSETLDAEVLKGRLCAIFAVYFLRHKGVLVTVDGDKVDPADVIKSVKPVDSGVAALQDGSGVFSWSLRAIEWKTEKLRERKKRSPRLKVFICDQDDLALEELELQAKDTPFYSFYISSPRAREWEEAGITAAHAEIQDMLIAAGQSIENFIKASDRQGARNFQAQMKDEKVFPYHGEPSSPVEAIEREVFTELAYTVSQSLPYEKFNQVNKRLIFQLLKRILEGDPERLVTLLLDVLDLPEAEKKGLEDLLQRKEVGRAIKLTSLVRERLAHIEVLKKMVFDMRKETLEVQHLQKFLEEDGLWIFSEEYELGLVEASLTSVLREILQENRVEDLEVDPVLNVNTGKSGRVDILFTRYIPGRKPGTKSCLLVELKRPAVVISERHVRQVDDYLLSLMKRVEYLDGRFFDCWLVGSEIDEAYLASLLDEQRQSRVVQERSRGRIVIKTWAELLDEAECKMRFLQDDLDSKVDERAVTEKQAKFAHAMPKSDPATRSAKTRRGKRQG